MPKTIYLILPNSFRGELFIIEDQANGQDWRTGNILVSTQGIALVNDLEGLSGVAPENFRASFRNGQQLGNAVLKRREDVSLWPVNYVESLALYFVVGTFSEKTQRENERLETNWRELVASIKSAG